MEFRPCIDIHDGKVKQIVGGTLSDTGAVSNFESDLDSVFYARLYHEKKLTGGHIILLNSVDSGFYQADKALAIKALKECPGELQVGGGITAQNAKEFIDAGASHIIVTSYVFKNGQINYENLDSLVEAVGKEHIVLDLSCRKRDGKYYIVTDRWQNFTNVTVSLETLDALSVYCDELLIHAADVEGKCQGIETELVKLLGKWNKLPVTYAGGVGSYEDLRLLKELSGGRIHVTVGSALDLFGGKLEFDKVLEICRA